jgi:hypothetical protein
VDLRKKNRKEKKRSFKESETVTNKEKKKGTGKKYGME